ncbi:MAG: hypothetical protein GY814_00655 [Gammaproteobacteria bacterium]|nr:hypothetical protein [Gammaproteobacteria bacterium]
MKRIAIFLFFTISFVLYGCSGGGSESGGDGSYPDVRPSGSISGTAFDNLLREAKVTAWWLSQNNLSFL